MQRALEVCIKSPPCVAYRSAWLNNNGGYDYITLISGELLKFRGTKKLGKYNPTPIDILAKDWIYEY